MFTVYLILPLKVTKIIYNQTVSIELNSFLPLKISPANMLALHLSTQ